MFSDVIKLCKNLGKSISTMESCTGGGVANAITNVPGSSDVFSFGAVTYSNEYKIRFGVPKKIIDKYTVYSAETARAMAKAIAEYTNSNFGIGITGKLKRVDDKNNFGDDDLVYICVYDRNIDKYYDIQHRVIYDTRSENKNDIIKIVSQMLTNILRGENGV